MSASSRPEAKQKGIKKYFTGNPCPKGHVADRFTSNGTCVECLREQSASPEKKQYDLQYYKDNKEKALAQSKLRYEENREKYSENSAKWVKNNPEKRRYISLAYKARRRSQESGGASGAEIRLWADSQEKSCYWCGNCCEAGFHIDHYEPLSKGGQHSIDNLVISCPTCNLKKSAKDPYEFAKTVGRLF